MLFLCSFSLWNFQHFIKQQLLYIQTHSTSLINFFQTTAMKLSPIHGLLTRSPTHSNNTSSTTSQVAAENSVVQLKNNENYRAKHCRNGSKSTRSSVINSKKRICSNGTPPKYPISVISWRIFYILCTIFTTVMHRSSGNYGSIHGQANL